MKQGVVMISEKHRRMLISLSMVICLLAVIVLVIAAVMLSLIISRKDYAAKVSNPEAAVQGKRMLVTSWKDPNCLQQAIATWLQNAFPSVW